MIGRMLLALGAASLLPLAAPGLAAPSRTDTDVRFNTAEGVREIVAQRASSDMRAFYAARNNRPLWLDGSGALSPAAGVLLAQLETARFDRIRPGRLKTRNLAQALDNAKSGDPADLVRAELALSKSYVAYVKALRAAPRGAMIYESEALGPVVPTTSAALQAAGAAPSLERHVRGMGWMHPLYAQMRAALTDGRYDADQLRRIAINLDRIRALPANPASRYVLIDAASARLWMYKDGQPVDTMRVVVGKAQEQTPTMAGYIRYAIVNPYWNVPDDLVRSRIAVNVLSKGPGYLRTGGYQVVSGWEEDAGLIDPDTIDWNAVAAGARHPRVRQLPGTANFMGKVKFMFPNAQGIYLHDTPDKALLNLDARQLSSGCVRLEDAGRLGQWLLGKPLPARLRAPEQRIELPEVVPVYITYLTALPEHDRITFRDDVYSRDSAVRGNGRFASNVP